MKPKKWAIEYSYELTSEAEVYAHSKQEAVDKVKEVVGPVKIESARTVRED